jgi:hypothetical protein
MGMDDFLPRSMHQKTGKWLLIIFAFVAYDFASIVYFFYV